MRASIGVTLGILLLASSVTANAATTLLRMADRSPVPMSRFVEEAGAAAVVFVGDNHEDGRLHGIQLEIIRALYAKDPQLAIGLEMFTRDSQKYLDDWSQGKLEEKDFLPIYARNWSYDWRLYRDIFIFARDNRIPMVALNVPKALIAKVVRQGAKALGENERKEVPPGDPWTLNPRQADYMRRIRAQVFGNAPARIPTANFDEAQALRNHTMAYAIAGFRDKFPKKKVVVVAGTWHAIKNGAPESLKEYGNLGYKVVLPDLPDFDWLKPGAEDADYLIPRGE